MYLERLTPSTSLVDQYLKPLKLVTVLNYLKVSSSARPSFRDLIFESFVFIGRFISREIFQGLG